jgi:RHS repeat-associated protein
VTNSYSPQAWLTGVQTQKGRTVTHLASAIAYSGPGGATGDMTSASLGGGTYAYSASYDDLIRSTDISIRSSRGSRLFEEARTFDGAGNVSTENATLSPGGTDTQVFCYDDQNRLTWAGSTGTPPCTGRPIPADSLSSARYSQTFAYDNLGRLTSGPQGTYSYADPTHLHGATGIGSSWSAAYDAVGDVTCRAASSTRSCSGPSPDGAQLTYDGSGQLVGWQDQPGHPTSTAEFLYDGQGQRVAQRTAQGGTSRTTVYVGNVEEVATSGSSTTTSTYYYANGLRLAMAVNGSFSYLADDALGSVDVALHGGSLAASTLYAPYGAVRYHSGTMPTDFGFTGQHSDATSGLDYYGARYYDPVAGQFASADTILPDRGFDLLALSRYAYVGGNPESRTDPTGNAYFDSAGNLYFPRGGGLVVAYDPGQDFTLPGYQLVLPRAPAGTGRPIPRPEPSYGEASNPPHSICPGGTCPTVTPVPDGTPSPWVIFLEIQLEHIIVDLSIGLGGPEVGGGEPKPFPGAGRLVIEAGAVPSASELRAAQYLAAQGAGGHDQRSHHG